MLPYRQSLHLVLAEAGRIAGRMPTPALRTRASKTLEMIETMAAHAFKTPRGTAVSSADIQTVTSAISAADAILRFWKKQGVGTDGDYALLDDIRQALRPAAVALARAEGDLLGDGGKRHHDLITPVGKERLSDAYRRAKLDLFWINYVCGDLERLERNMAADQADDLREQIGRDNNLLCSWLHVSTRYTREAERCLRKAMRMLLPLADSFEDEVGPLLARAQECLLDRAALLVKAVVSMEDAARRYHELAPRKLHDD